MNAGRRVTRLVHDEHVETIGLVERVERLLARVKPGAPPAPSDADAASVVGGLLRSLRRDLERHFAFEQNELFPLLAGGGDSDIAQFLTEEHDGMRAVAEELAAIAPDERGAVPTAQWPAFHRLAREYAERQISHIQKEEMALLPMLDDAIDDETDARLAGIFAAAR